MRHCHLSLYWANVIKNSYRVALLQDRHVTMDRYVSKRLKNAMTKSTQSGGTLLAESADDALDVFKALSNPVRLQILQWLREPRKNFPVDRGIADPDEVGVCVSQITEKVGLAQSTVSSFMGVLERADLVIATRVGKWTHYRRNEERIRKLLEMLGRTL